MTPLEIINLLVKARASDIREILEDLQKDYPDNYEIVSSIIGGRMMRKLNLNWGDIRP